MKTASCSCGQLSISVNGDPEVVLICHCRECQKATGSPFGVSTYWPQSAVVEIQGTSSSHTRLSDVQRTLTNHFCPTCGGRLYWYADFVPESIGIAVGNFEQPDLLVPAEEFWTIRKHPWVSFSCTLKSHVGDD